MNMLKNNNKIVSKIKTTSRMSADPIQKTEFEYNDNKDNKDILENKWINLTEREKFKKRLINSGLKNKVVKSKYKYKINNFIELEERINIDIKSLYNDINYLNDKGFMMTNLHKYYVKDTPNYPIQEKYHDILKIIKKVNEQKIYILDVKYICNEDEKTIGIYFIWI